jgi:membrane-associated phospholipid phosphatase
MMRSWEVGSLVFFVFVALAAALARPRLPRVGTLYVGASAGVLFVLVIAAIPYVPVVHDWLAPPIALLIGYWTSGLLFREPRPLQERALLEIDRSLRVLDIAKRLPAAIAALLEAGYAAVYIVIPAALVIHLTLTPQPDLSRFWTVILITDYLCFAGLVWVQTRPPRSIENVDSRNSRMRRFNLRMLGAASIQVNTFPSGHAAEALAAALLVVDAPLPIVGLMFLIALAISAGAVFGRYHYAADAFAGWIVAIAVWMLFR